MGQTRDPVDGSEAARAERAAALDLMRRRALSLVVELESAEGIERVELVEKPILRYSTPTLRQFDQTLWTWGRVGRPVAIATIGPKGCELVSVADGPLSMTAKSGWKWTPRGSGMTWKPVPDAPALGKTATERARQMKEIARKFTASASSKKIPYVELRLVDQPLHRYADPDRGLIDGSVFSFAAGTNPELLLLVECRREPQGKLVWQYGCARMSAANCEAKIGETIVWTCSNDGPHGAAEPYYIVP
ncbi:MAG TPA: hypothetical protein VGH74_12890, partial [Planctomycetaceae bacterium]